MHSEENGTTERLKQQSGGDSPAKRMVRSLLGLPEKANSRLHGHVPVPPGAFRYHMRPSAGDVSIPSPLSGQTPDHSADMQSSLARLDRQEEGPQAIAPGEPTMVDRQAADDDQRVVSPKAAKTAKRPLAKPAVSGAEKLRQTAADIAQAAAGEKMAKPGGKKKITIPGRSTARQVFAALAQAESDNLPDSGPPTDMPPHTGQMRHGSAAINKADRSEHLHRGPEPALPPADRRWTPRSAMPLPSAAQAEGLAPQAQATIIMAAAQTTSPATGQRANLLGDMADKTAERGSEARIMTAAPKRDQAVLQQQREHPPAQAELAAEERHPAATPARRPDEDGAQQIEELRRTFYEMITKKTTAAATAQDNEPTTTAGRETTPQPPLQQVVVINRTSDSRSRGRLPAAFWERSYMARTTLKMIR